MKGTYLYRHHNYSKYRERRDIFFYVSQGLKKNKSLKSDQLSMRIFLYRRQSIIIRIAIFQILNFLS